MQGRSNLLRTNKLFYWLSTWRSSASRPLLLRSQQPGRWPAGSTCWSTQPTIHPRLPQLLSRRSTAPSSRRELRCPSSLRPGWRFLRCKWAERQRTSSCPLFTVGTKFGRQNPILHTREDHQRLTFRHGWKVRRHVLRTRQDHRPLGGVHVEGGSRLDFRAVRHLEVVVLRVLFELARKSLSITKSTNVSMACDFVQNRF
jgi:hypothetical protein